MKRIVDFLIAERTVVVMVLLNSAALFAMGYAHRGTPWGNVFFWVDYGCVLYFLLEAGLKIGRHRWSGYWASGWNRFDFLIVVASLPVIASPWVDLHQFAVILLLRLGRLFRLFRLMRFIPNRDHLAAGIARALRASLGVLLGLVLVNFILALGGTMLFGELAPEHFGDPLTSIYSMFRVFTVEGWYEIPDLLVERTQQSGWAVLARIYFVISVTVGGILGLSLANAVFVDEMMMDNTDHLEQRLDELTEELRGLRSEVRKALGAGAGDGDESD